MCIGRSQHKVSVYADDMLFSLTNPLISLPNLFREFKLYGSLYYLKINFSKSEAMGVEISSSLLRSLQLRFKFRWTDRVLKYPGTFIPADHSRTFDLNFPPLLQNVRALLEKWNSGLHSWFGRCNIVKMSVLPNFSIPF